LRLQRIARTDLPAAAAVVDRIAAAVERARAC